MFVVLTDKNGLAVQSPGFPTPEEAAEYALAFGPEGKAIVASCPDDLFCDTDADPVLALGSALLRLIARDLVDPVSSKRQPEQKLSAIATLLSEMGGAFSNHGANDFGFSTVIKDVETRREIMRGYHEMNGDPEEFNPEGDYADESDFVLMFYAATELRARLWKLKFGDQSS